METLRWIGTKLCSLPRKFYIVLLWLLAAIFLLYYPIGMIVVHEINDDPNFSAGVYDIPQGSKAVAVAAALIDREVNRHSWTPNDPFFMPGAMLDRMPAYQRGIISGLSRFAIEMSDQIGRTRGSSQMDPDLEKAAGLLKYSPTVWIFDFSTSLLPTASSEKQYQSAMEALVNYNKRLASGKATMDRRADNLMETLNRIASDLGSSSAIIDSHIKEGSPKLIDTRADEVYYLVKGRLYSSYLIIKALGEDYKDVLRERNLQSTWDQTLKTFEEAIRPNHFFVFNSNPDAQFLPNHLAVMGFYLQRSRTQLREISDILLK
jgi:hypothetical protein